MSDSMTLPPCIVQFGSGNLRRLGPHLNPGLEIVCVIRGTLMWQTSGRVELVPPGSVFFTLPWQKHGSVFDFEPGHEWVYVIVRVETRRQGRRRTLRLPRGLGIHPRDEQHIVRGLLRSKQHCFMATDDMKRLLPSLVDELKRPGPLHGSRVAALTGAAVVELGRCVLAGASTPSPDGRERLRPLLDRLHADYERPWTLDQMAELIHLRRTQASHLVHHWTGDTPAALLNRIRITNARKMLRESSLSVTEIAMRCGYSSSQYFARVFKKVTGEQPRTYRVKGLV